VCHAHNVDTQVRSVGNSQTLHETALVEAFNLKAAIEFLMKNVDATKEALTDMPPRSEEELDPVRAPTPILLPPMSIPRRHLLQGQVHAEADAQKLQTVWISHTPRQTWTAARAKAWSRASPRASPGASWKAKKGSGLQHRPAARYPPPISIG
jgi:hypothetical protein